MYVILYLPYGERLRYFGLPTKDKVLNFKQKVLATMFISTHTFYYPNKGKEIFCMPNTVAKYLVAGFRPVPTHLLEVVEA
jgi:hypothetical protein